MDVSISRAEEFQLQDALQALLSPLEYLDVDAWRSAVNHSVRELLGADVATFILPSTDSVDVYCEEIDPGVMNTYAAQIEPLDVRFNVWERQVALGAWGRETAHQPYADAYYRSAYYNEYILPLRAHDAIESPSRSRRPWKRRAWRASTGWSGRCGRERGCTGSVSARRGRRSGRTNAEVASTLVISPHTAERHTGRILLKLDVHSRAAVGPRILKG